MRNRKKDNNHAKLLALLMLCCVALQGCAVSFTNQAPPMGGCTGEPQKVYC